MSLHVPSCPCIILNIPSYAFIFLHVLHIPPCAVIVLRSPSYSFISLSNAGRNVPLRRLVFLSHSFFKGKVVRRKTRQVVAAQHYVPLVSKEDSYEEKTYTSLGLTVSSLFIDKQIKSGKTLSVELVFCLLLPSQWRVVHRSGLYFQLKIRNRKTDPVDPCIDWEEKMRVGDETRWPDLQSSFRAWVLSPITASSWRSFQSYLGLPAKEEE